MLARLSQSKKFDWVNIVARCGVIFSARDINLGNHPRVPIISRSWLEIVLALARILPCRTCRYQRPRTYCALREPRADPSGPCLTQRALRCASKNASHANFGADTRDAVGMRMTVTNVCLSTCAGLDISATLIFEIRRPFHETALALQVSHVTMTPLHRTKALQAMRAATLTQAGCTCWVASTTCSIWGEYNLCPKTLNRPSSRRQDYPTSPCVA